MRARDVEIVVADDADEAARRAGELLAEAASQGAHIALSGGSSPRPAYERAAFLQPDWSKAEVWWADERCVPPDDQRSNFRLARESLLDRLARLPAAVHRIRGELDPQAAASDYSDELRGVVFRLAFLGIGPDGHTASLFPGSAALSDERPAVAVAGPDVGRVTLTPSVLCAATVVCFLVLGHEKADAAGRAFAGPPDPQTPASTIRSRTGRTLAILDRDAARSLD